MLGWIGIFAGLCSWAKESYDRNHPKYTPGTEEHWRKAAIGQKRFLTDFDTVPYEERARRRALGYYEGENIDISKR